MSAHVERLGSGDTNRKLREKLKKLQAVNTAYRNRLKVMDWFEKKEKDMRKEKSKRVAHFKSLYKDLEASVAHIVKDESWDRGTSKQLHLEMIIRTIVSYRKLERDGILTFNEFAFLLTGSQLEYFSWKDIEQRYGDIGFRKKANMRAMMDAGYIKKIHSKELFYITLDGKSRFNAILGHIYREKGLGWPVKREDESEQQHLSTVTDTSQGRVRINGRNYTRNR